MKEQFEQLIPREDAPDELKQEVMNHLSTIKLVAEIVDLYTTKYVVSGIKLGRMVVNDYDEPDHLDDDKQSEK